MMFSYFFGKGSSQTPWRKCIYDPTTMKYLVMVKDDVEAGDERMKEFEQELQDMGLFDTSFSLGDILEDEDQEPEEVDDNPKKKRKLDEFPPIEGEKTLPEYLGQFKKACLTRKANLKSCKERLEKDKSTGYEMLASILNLGSSHSSTMILVVKNLNKLNKQWSLKCGLGVISRLWKKVQVT